MKKWVKFSVICSYTAYGEILLDSPIVPVKPPIDDRLYQKNLEKTKKKDKENKKYQDIEKVEKVHKPIPSLLFSSSVNVTSRNSFLKKFQIGSEFSWMHVKSSYLYGVRWIEFSGTQIINNDIPVRYTDIRYGPMIGFGKVIQNEKVMQAEHQQALSIDDKAKMVQKSFSQKGGYAVLGLALSSKRFFFDPIHKELKENMGGMRISVFSEIAYMQFLVENFSINYQIGLEKGPDDIHSWLGVSLGCWF